MTNEAFEYTGSWNCDVFEGLGLLRRFGREEMYFGGWKNGLKFGLGYEIVEGREYLGFFEEREGYAIVKLPDKEEKFAYFTDGKISSMATEEDCMIVREKKLSLS